MSKTTAKKAKTTTGRTKTVRVVAGTSTHPPIRVDELQRIEERLRANRAFEEIARQRREEEKRKLESELQEDMDLQLEQMIEKGWYNPGPEEIERARSRCLLNPILNKLKTIERKIGELKAGRNGRRSWTAIQQIVIYKGWIEYSNECGKHKIRPTFQGFLDDNQFSLLKTPEGHEYERDEIVRDKADVERIIHNVKVKSSNNSRQSRRNR